MRTLCSDSAASRSRRASRVNSVSAFRSTSSFRASGSTTASTPPPVEIGQLQAWDVDKGEMVWSHGFEDSEFWGPVLTTAGDLVFAGGTTDRKFRAFNATTGDVLWEFTTNSGVTGAPSTFAIDGTQYIAVQSGWGVDAESDRALLARCCPDAYPPCRRAA